MVGCEECSDPDTFLAGCYWLRTAQFALPLKAALQLHCITLKTIRSGFKKQLPQKRNRDESSINVSSLKSSCLEEQSKQQ
jgi:hypothetical protein